jgi:PAS domain S-box-containing protein
MTKKSMIKTKEQLIIENEELQSRLFEVEETLNAIRNGEVDAIMVSGAQGEQVYSVSSAETPYRTFIEEMSEGAVTLTKDGVILYCNQTFAELVQEPIEQVIGSDIKGFVAPKEKSKIENLLFHMPKKNEVAIISSRNSLHLKLSLTHLPEYMEGDIYVLLVTDVSELKKKENELREIIVVLLNHIKALRALRIENISETLEVEGRKNKLEIANNKLYKEIIKLTRIVAEMKQKLKESQKKMIAGKSKS